MIKLILTVSMALLLAACELTSTTLTEPEDALIVEAYVIVSGAGPFVGATATLLVHGVRGSPGSVNGPPSVTATVTDAAGTSTTLTEQPISRCILTGVDASDLGRCYAADLPADVQPGATLSLRVEAPGNQVITGVTTLPDDFQVITPVAHGQACQLPADTRLEMAWSPSAGAWAYPSEVRFQDLGPQLAAEDPQFTDLADPLVIFGLAISDSDTTISFPNEFGLFDRFDDEIVVRALVEIQDGLPAGVVSDMTIAAADRNWINWERGGNFNPSGSVRVPSVSGDGFGVFGSMVLKNISIVVGPPEPGGPPACTGLSTGP